MPCRICKSSFIKPAEIRVQGVCKHPTCHLFASLGACLSGNIWLGWLIWAASWICFRHGQSGIIGIVSFNPSCSSETYEFWQWCGCRSTGFFMSCKIWLGPSFSLNSVTLIQTFPCFVLWHDPRISDYFSAPSSSATHNLLEVMGPSHSDEMLGTGTGAQRGNEISSVGNSDLTWRRPWICRFILAQ